MENIENINQPILNILIKVFPQFDLKELIYTKAVIPKEQAWDIYKIRYDIAVEGRFLDDSSIKLYESALENLKSFEEEKVTIHVFDVDNGWGLLVFSDIDDENIIGHVPLGKEE